MTPIATILLDTPGSAGPVRGVICWDTDADYIVVLEPHRRPDQQTTTTSPLRLAKARTIIEALDATAQLYGERSVHPDYQVWDLQYLCEDAEDYAQ